MTIETVYLPQKNKDQLIKLKRATGIQYWNVLCRWALCLSLADKTIPSQVAASSNEHAIEMSWKVFGGQEQDLYSALIIERCKQDKMKLEKEVLSLQLRSHLHRGIGLMLDLVKNKKIEGLFELLGVESVKTQ
jgi:DNA sulfur modification protein DndE